MLAIAGDIDESNYDVKINVTKLISDKVAQINEPASKDKFFIQFHSISNVPFWTLFFLRSFDSSICTCSYVPALVP